MKTFISDIIPKIQRYSQKLDNITLLSNQPWVFIEDENQTKNVYIFRSNNDLLISQNGKVEKNKWTYLGNNLLLIDKQEQSYLFNLGFFDKNILALKVDGTREYALFINEVHYEEGLNSYNRLVEFIERTYLRRKPIETVVEDSRESLENLQYKIIRERNGWSFTTGDYIEYEIEFIDKKQGKILYISNRSVFEFSTYNSVETFNSLGSCLKGLRLFLTEKK